MFNAGTTGGNNSYYPKDGDIVAIESAEGGFIGGVKGAKTHPHIVDASKDWENFIFEATGDKFALKQKVSNFFIGGTQNAGDQPFLSEKKDAWEIFQYNVLPNGLINIVNSKGSKLSRDDKKVQWADKNTIAESWKFKLIQANPAHNTSVATSTGVVATAAAPPNGTVVALQNAAGGFVGGFKNEGSELQVVPKMQDWEKFVVEDKGNNTFALKQKISGFYLGWNSAPGQRVKLAPKAGDNEIFALEGKGNGQFAIRNSHKSYLSKKDDKHVEFANTVGAHELWKIDVDPSMNVNWNPMTASVPLSGATHNTSATGVPVNGQTYGIAIPNGSGWIGTIKGLHQDVKIAKKLQEWEYFTYQTHGNQFGLKQVVSGYFLGHRNGKGEHVALAEKLQDHELFTLEPRGGAFAIKNGNNLHLSRSGDNVQWSDQNGENELWKFDPVAHK